MTDEFVDETTTDAASEPATPAGEAPTVAELTHDLRVHQTELEMQAQELRESNLDYQRASHRFQQLFEALPQSALVTDRFGEVLSANREAERLLGAHIEYQRVMVPLLGSDAAAVARIRRAFAAAARKGTAEEREVELSGTGAEPLIVDIEIERLDEATPVDTWPVDTWPVDTWPVESDRFIVLVTDWTERHGEQEQLRLLAAAVSTMEDMVVVTDAGSIDEPGPSIVFVNDAFERRTGYSREEVIGRSPRFLQGPDTDRGELDRIRAALEHRQTVTAELLNYGRDGRTYWLEIVIAPILDRHGVCTHFVAVQRDVSDRRSAEQRSQQALRLAALGQLTGGVAHDFNNLLSVIIGYADELATDSELPAEHRQSAEVIRGAGERGAELTSRLLSFGRMQVLKPTSVDVNERLTSLVDSMLRRTLGGHVTVELDLGVDVGRVEIDPAQFESAIVNLAVNARDAVADGGRVLLRTSTLDVAQPEATTLEITAGRYAVVQVLDDGEGIIADTLTQVFDPFFTTKPTGQGTGLGLPMVYGFVKQSNGAVSIESSPGQGTTVTMLLPLSDADHGAERPDSAGPLTQGDGALILLVEDDAMVRSLSRSQLTSLGYRVVDAGDGAEALALLAAEPTIALLFTDVLLPGGMDGKVLADAVHLEQPDLPVLFTSGFTRHVLSSDGRLAPGVHLLEKPYRRSDLARALDAVLAGTVLPA